MKSLQDLELQSRNKQAAWMLSTHRALTQESTSSPSVSPSVAQLPTPRSFRSKHGSNISTSNGHPSFDASKAFHSFRSSLHDNQCFGDSSSDEAEVEFGQEFDEQLPSMSQPSRPPSVHRGSAPAKAREDPLWVKAGLPSRTPLADDRDDFTSGSVNFGLACGSISVQFDAHFLSVSRKSILGGLHHYDEPSSVDLTPFFLMQENESDATRFHDAILLQIDLLHGQLDALRLMSFDSSHSKEVKIVLKSMVQETFWRLGQYAGIISELAKQLDFKQKASEESVFKWEPLEGSLVDFCQEVANIWYSLGLQPSISTSGSVQWIHSEVTIYVQVHSTGRWLLCPLCLYSELNSAVAPSTSSPAFD